MATLRPHFQARVLRTYSKWLCTQHQVVVRLQRWWRLMLQLRPHNHLDCITMEPVQPPVFRHVSDNGHVTAFSAMTLAEYLHSSGNFSHPEYRTQFLSVEIRRLDRITQFRFNLHRNQQHIQLQSQQQRLELQFEEFLVNDLETQFQNCIQICQNTNNIEDWSRDIRGAVDQLLNALVALRQFSYTSSQQALQKHARTLEQLLNGVSLNQMDEHQHRLLSLLLLLNNLYLVQ